MKRIFLAAVIAFAVASTATGQLIDTFGDFDVYDTAVDTRVVFFGTPPIMNPQPFPDPVPVDQAAMWPTETDYVTVGQTQGWLLDEGYPHNDFMISLHTGSGVPASLNVLEIWIGGELAAEGAGFLPLEPYSQYVFDAGIYLSDYDYLDEIRLVYEAMTPYDIHHMRLAVSPEPVSMAFLGTGLIGMILIRRKRRA